MTSTGTNPPWQLLVWDSEFFGFRVARINHSLSVHELSSFWNWHRDNRIQCTYYLCPVDKLDAIDAATSCGFRLVDIRITLAYRTKTIVHTASHNTPIRPAVAGDALRLEELAGNLHTDSRFFADTRFPRDKARNLYARWMNRDLQDPDGVVLVWPNPDNLPIGYLTCQVRKSQGNIGLFGVAEGHQGQGIGSALLRQGMRWFEERCCQVVHVVTQGKNLAALASYTSQGFRVTAISQWLHHWTEPG